MRGMRSNNETAELEPPQRLNGSPGSSLSSPPVPESSHAGHFAHTTAPDLRVGSSPCDHQISVAGG